MKYQVPKSVLNKNISFCVVDELLLDRFTKDKTNVVVLTSDHLSAETMFLPVEQQSPMLLEQIITKTKEYPNYRFTIIHNCLNIKYQSKNCNFINWAPEWITNQRNNYLNIAPQSEKNFEHDYFWICLNRNKRVHRYVTAMFLLGHDFEQFGLITLDPSEILEHGNWESWVWWWTHNQRNEINDIEQYFPILKIGFDKIKKGQGYQSIISSPEDAFFYHNDKNFDHFLRPRYASTCVEVINETIWFPDAGGIVSEKFINSVYGFNLPIIIGVGNTVSYLRQLGFDLFDNVIDHSYDSEPSPTVRLTSALDKNKQLFNNKHKSILAWKHCKSQMDYNINVLRALEKNAEQRWTDLISHI